jgi:hypothetical protein
LLNFGLMRFAFLPTRSIALDDLRCCLTFLDLGARPCFAKRLFGFTRSCNFEALLAIDAFTFRTNFPTIAHREILRADQLHSRVFFKANAFCVGVGTRGFTFDSFAQRFRLALRTRCCRERPARAFDIRLTCARERIEAIFLARHGGINLLFSWAIEVLDCVAAPHFA